MRALSRELPVVVAGAGPGGISAGISLDQAGQLVRVFEQRGPEATRARNLYLRPEAHDSLVQLGLGDPGPETSIRWIENEGRRILGQRGVPVDYERAVFGIREFADHVAVRVQGPGSAAPETIRAKLFVDATGGRFAPTNSGVFTREPIGPSHPYVTAQFDRLPPHGRVSGVFDRRAGEGLVTFPSQDGRGFVAYLDLPPGRPVDEAATLARFDTLAGQLNLGSPSGRPQFFDARQHLAREAAQGRIVKVGDSAGNAEPYIGAGVAAALVDGRSLPSLVRALDHADPETARLLMRNASHEIVEGHRQLTTRGGVMLAARSIGLRFLPNVRLDAGLRQSDLGSSLVLDRLATELSHRRIGLDHASS